MADKAGEGASRSLKMRVNTARRTRSKPYERPREKKCKKSFLETVKDYLSPSWLFGYNNIKENEESDEDEEDDLPSQQQVEASRGDTAVVLNGQDRVVHDSSQIPQAVSVTSKSNAAQSSEMASNNGYQQQQLDSKDNACLKTTSSGCSSKLTNAPYQPFQLKRKPLSSIFHTKTSSSLTFQPHNLASGPSFSSEMSQPCSTLATASTRMAVSTTMAASTRMAVSVTKSHPTSQPLTTSTPLFSISTFITPVPKCSFVKKRPESPFYPGPVTYGGANSQPYSSCKRMRRSSPMSEKYQPVIKQQIKAKPLPTTSHRGSTSQTAQRILRALESVSSPLKDVRRIPSTITSPSASLLSFSSKIRTRPPRTKVNPKISSLQTKFLIPPVGSLCIPGNANIISTPVCKTTDSSSTQSMFAGLKDTVLKTSLPSEFTPIALPMSLSPIDKSTKSCGKMKTTPRGATHYSSRKSMDNENAMINHLPEIVHAVPLPVPASGLFPSLLSNSSDQTVSKNATAVRQPAESKLVSSNSPKNSFIFTTPKSKRNMSVKEALSIADEEVSFLFSLPVSVKTANKKEIVGNKTTSKISKSPPAKGSWKCQTCLVQNKDSDRTCVACSTAEPLSQNVGDLSAKFGPPANSWKCQTCLIQNKDMDVKCVACDTAKPGLPSLDLSTKFAPSAGLWKCATCLIQNNVGDTLCAACTAPKPGPQPISLSTKFAPSAGSWKCSTCLIQNNVGDTLCVACTAPKPAPQTVDLKVKCSAPAGSWKCETCLIKNKECDVTCVACETAKPRSTASTDSSSKTSFNFGSSSDTKTTSSGFTLGFNESSETKPGFTLKTTSGETASPQFNFGRKTEVQQSNGFKFGSSSPGTGCNNDANKQEFKFGVTSSLEGSGVNNRPSVEKNDIAGAKDKSSTQAGNDDASTATGSSLSGVDVTTKQSGFTVAVKTGAMNIAQAAALGLLKVPAKTGTSVNTGEVSSSGQSPIVEPSCTSIGTTSSLGAGDPGVPSVPGVPDASNEPITKSKPFVFGESGSTTVPSANTIGFGSITEKSELPPFPFTSESVTKVKQAPDSKTSPFVFTTQPTVQTGDIFKFGASSSGTIQDSGDVAPAVVVKHKAAPLFTFGATTIPSSTASTEKTKAPVFSFGAAANGPTTNGQAQTTSAATFPFTGGFVTSQPSNTANNETSLGGEDMEADSNNNHDNEPFAANSNTPFNFTNQTSGSTVGLFGSSGTTSNTPGGFSFGSSGGSTSIPSFQFGGSNTLSGGFNFTGSTPSSGADGGGSAPFVFGQTGANTVNLVTSAPSTVGFGFTAQPASTSNPQEFNFTGTATPQLQQPTATTVGSQPTQMFNVGTTTTGNRVFKKAVRRRR